MAEQTDTLKSMFPQMEESVITTVLEAHGNNLERSIAALLEISDPESAARNRLEEPHQSQQHEIANRGVRILSFFFFTYSPLSKRKKEKRKVIMRYIIKRKSILIQYHINVLTLIFILVNNYNISRTITSR